MQGLDLARAYYEAYGKALLREFPALRGLVAVGLVGEGSECFGFDDELSMDHDFGPSFCLWLTDEDCEAVGPALQQAYEALPQSFMGYPARVCSAFGAGRVGVLRTSDFYRRHTGSPDGRFNPAQWLRLPEAGLAAATNGAVFDDPLGEFSAIRGELLRYYPEDIRLKKIAARLALMAQSGQYNYARCMRRKEWTAAFWALAEFTRHAASLVFLLNRRYAPFYKWTHRALRELPALAEAAGLLEELALAGIDPQNRQSAARLNMDDRRVVLVETFCRMVVAHLQQEGLTDSDADFLSLHAASVTTRITNSAVRSLPLTEG